MMEPRTSKIEGTKDKNACSKSRVKSKARHVLVTAGPKELSLAKAQPKGLVADTFLKREAG